GVFEVAAPGGSPGHLAADRLASLPGSGTPLSADGPGRCTGRRTTHDGRKPAASLSGLRLHRHVGERGSCDPSHPPDQPPTANPPPIVLSDAGTDAPKNSGSCPYWIDCLRPLPAGLSEGVRDMGEPSPPAQACKNAQQSNHCRTKTSTLLSGSIPNATFR